MQVSERSHTLHKWFLKPNARYSLSELRAILKVRTNAEVEEAISYLRQNGMKIVWSRLEQTYYLSRVPTPYSNFFDFTDLPAQGILGCISDTHLASDADRLDLVEQAYDGFEKEGITTVLHAGDITDGWEVYKGHGQFVKTGGAQNQAVYCKKHYPKRDSILTYFIGGNHDLRSYEKSGVDQCSLMVNSFDHHGKHSPERKDLIYLGQYSRYLLFPEEVSVHMIHPRGAGAYAKSYAQQRRAREMKADTRPNLQISGHYHSFNFLKEDLTWMLAMPGLQDETEFFIRQGYRRDLGYVILEYSIEDSRFKSLKVNCIELD